MPRFLWRVIRKCWTIHFLLPLVLGMAIDMAFARWWHGTLNSFSRADLLTYWQEHIANLLSVYVVFLFVVVYLMLQESAVNVMDIGCLDDILPTAKSYFAIAT